MNIKNLQVLVEFLNGIDAKEFDMEAWERKCGTVCCAIGWTHVLFQDITCKMDPFTWDEVSNEVYDIEYGGNIWRWCFGSEWNGIDNTPKGCALRIGYVIEYGVAPITWDEQQQGQCEYMFAKETFDVKHT